MRLLVAALILCSPISLMAQYQEPGPPPVVMVEPAPSPVVDVTLPTASMTFIGVQPCRVWDTRTSAPPALVKNTTRDFQVIHGCGIPPEALAVSASWSALSTLGAGFLEIFPQGTIRPGVVSLTYNAAGQNATGSGTLLLGVDGGVSVFTGGAGAEFVIEVNGYYAPAQVTAGVTSVNGRVGAVEIAAGLNVTVSTSGRCVFRPS